MDKDEVKKTPALSPYIAKVLLRKGPKAAYDAHYLLGNAPRKPRGAVLTLGLVIDRILFSKEHELIVHAPYKKPKDLKNWQVPCTQKVYDKAKSIALTAGPELAKIDFPGPGWDTNKKLIWTSDGVLCKGYPDIFRYMGYTGTGNTIVTRRVLDLKTCFDMTEDGRRQAIEKYDYDLQLAAYADSEETYCNTYIAWVCTQEPWSAKLQPLDSIQLAFGMAKWQKAKQIWKQCMDTNTWPDWSKDEEQVKNPWLDI